MKKTLSSLIFSALLMLVLLACQFDLGQVDQNEVATAVAATVSVQVQPPPPQDPPPQAPPPPTPANTLPAAPSPEPKPCNKAKFISETVPDHTVFSPNESFTKTWRLENIGTCTWNTSYRVVLQSGDALGMHSAQYFTQIIKPGERMDVLLQLKAPSKKGEYTNWWQLQDDQGKKFGQIYVIIEVK